MSDDPLPPAVVSENPLFVYFLDDADSLALGNMRDRRVFTSMVLFEIIWFCA